MACSFAVARITFIAILYSSLNWNSRAETDFLLRNSSLWDRKKRTVVKKSEEGEWGIGWFSPSAGVATSCDKSTQNWFYLHKIKTDANRVFVNVDFEITRTFCNVSDCGLFLRFYQDTLNFSVDQIRSDEFLPKLIESSVTLRRVSTLYVDTNSGSPATYIAFAFQAKGVCVRIYNMSVYYNYCPRDASTSVILERTPAPSTGLKKVSGYCSQSNSKKGSMLASCDSGGKWKDFSLQPNLCRCSAGQEFNNNTGHCSPCKVNFYKKPEDEGACKACPKNSETNGVGSTSCFCFKNFYRNKEEDDCREIPPKPANLNYTVLRKNGIRLHWKMVEGHQNVYYRVKCVQRNTRSTLLVPCEDLSIRKDGVNSTGRNLTVSGLAVKTHYVFRVTSLNDVSGKADESQWKFAAIDVQLPDEAATPTVTVSTPISNSERVKTTPVLSTTQLDTNTSSTEAPPSREKQKNPGSGGMSLGPMIGVAIAGLLLVLLVVAIIMYRKKRMKKERLMEDMDMSTIEKSYVDPAKYGNPEKAVKKFAKEIDRRQVKLEGVIGEGEFARVHKGQLCRPNEPNIDVAVKVLKPGSAAKNRADFLTEAAVMAQFKDMNIVALEGVVTISHPVMIITEFMHNGALSKYLAENKTRFGEIDLLTMARGIASGMRYLARMRFVHRDLAARNVLVNENLVCKVADFGLTRELEESCQGEYVTQGGKIPIRWTAPEAYKHRRFTTASDVWSFGIVLWEIMSYADRPYGNWDNYMVMDQVDANYRLTAPTNCPKIVHQLMMECWKSDRNQRPAFADIVDMLERWIKNPYLLKDYEYVTEKTLMADRKSCIARSIREYLQTIKMERYVDNFIDFGYTELYQIQHFKDTDLVGIGVPLVGHRNKIMKSLSLRSERERLLPTDV